MKKVFFLIVVILVILITKSDVWKNYVLTHPLINTRNIFLDDDSTSPKLPKNTIEYSDKGATYSASWLIVNNPSDMSLFKNSDKLTTKDFKKTNNCKEITSAGFYDENDNPIGLFISNGITVKSYTQNTLLNGVFSIKDDIASITSNPSKDATYAIQSGPQLYKNGSQLNLAINNDESARRLMVAVTPSQQILFVIFYLSDNSYGGPLLQELPHHVSIFQTKTKILISEALNLDGGSASAFETQDVSLGEITTVGSFFCIN